MNPTHWLVDYAFVALILLSRATVKQWDAPASSGSIFLLCYLKVCNWSALKKTSSHIARLSFPPSSCLTRYPCPCCLPPFFYPCSCSLSSLASLLSSLTHTLTSACLKIWGLVVWSQSKYSIFFSLPRFLSSLFLCEVCNTEDILDHEHLAVTSDMSPFRGGGWNWNWHCSGELPKVNAESLH